MRRRWKVRLGLLTLFTTLVPWMAVQAGYTSPNELQNACKDLAKNHANVTRTTLATTVGGHDLTLLTLGDPVPGKPALLVVANAVGDCPVATEAALGLARHLADDWASTLEDATWYIIPSANPDGAARFFTSPRSDLHANGRPVNDDMDDAVNEDGPQDLNGDGWVTMIRQRSPEGDWLAVEGNPVLMREADSDEGERGVYRLFQEGTDEDGDGEINEDGRGGVIPGHNFPHAFEHYIPENGRYAASEVESRAILSFAFDHPDIAMVLHFGRTNTLRTLPPSDKEAESGSTTYELPDWFANRVGVEEGTELPLKKIVELGRQLTGNTKLSEDRVLRWLGAGAAVNPDRHDVGWWKAVSRQYNDFLKDNSLDDDRIDPPPSPPGSVEEWAYYQYGVPSFALDFWSPPTPTDPDSGDTTATLPEGVDETDAALFASDPDAFVPWTPYHHPTLGDVEIGGMKPWAAWTPPADQVELLVEAQLPFVRTLPELLPRITIDSVSVEQSAKGVFRVNAWIVNNGDLPYPTYQGDRTERPEPAVATLEGGKLTFLEGRSRQVLDLLDGHGGVEKVTWLVNGRQGGKATLSVTSPSAGQMRQTVTLAGGER